MRCRIAHTHFTSIRSFFHWLRCGMCLNTKRKRSSFVFVCACLSATFIISQALRNETSHEPAVHGNLEASYANSSVKGNTNCSFHDDSWRRVEVIAFTHDGDIKEWQLVSLTLARYFNPRACLLVLTTMRRCGRTMLFSSSKSTLISSHLTI